MSSFTDIGPQLLASIAPVVPVADFVDASHAADCCELFNQLLVPSVEVTLRRDNAWQSLEACVREMPDAAVGVGTVVAADQLRKAADLRSQKHWCLRQPTQRIVT